MKNLLHIHLMTYFSGAPSHLINVAYGKNDPVMQEVTRSLTILELVEITKAEQVPDYSAKDRLKISNYSASVPFKST